MIDANEHALNKYMDEQEQGELAYEAYQLKCSDDVTELLGELRGLEYCYLVVTAVHSNLKEAKEYIEYLRELIYGIFEEITVAFISNCGDYDFDHVAEMKEFISESTCDMCLECE